MCAVSLVAAFVTNSVTAQDSAAPPPAAPPAPAPQAQQAEPAPPPPAPPEAAVEKVSVERNEPAASRFMPPPAAPHGGFDSDPDVRHHLGLSVRVSAGMGYGNANRKVGKVTSDVTGLNGLLSFELGATPFENLIVFGRLSGFAFNNISSEMGQPLSGAYFGLLGGGARYHFMPYNLYASGALSLAAVSVTTDLVKGLNARPGFGFSLEAGKDFWIGTGHDERDLGVGLRFEYARCGTASKGGAWSGLGVSFVLSVGYN